MNDCVFCKIASGEIPALKVYEDDQTVAFMDTAKDVDGHILVIPKKHCGSILDCDADTLFSVAQTVKMISNHLVEHCGYEGINLLNANHASAGQSVPHFHIHVIPRKSHDGIDAWPAFTGAGQEIREVFERIKMNP